MPTTRHAADKVRADVHHLAEDLALLATSLRDGATDDLHARLAAIRDRAAELADCSEVEARLKQGGAFVRDQPLLSLAASFAVGWLAGRLFAR